MGKPAQRLTIGEGFGLRALYQRPFGLGSESPLVCLFVCLSGAPSWASGRGARCRATRARSGRFVIRVSWCDARSILSPEPNVGFQPLSV